MGRSTYVVAVGSNRCGRHGRPADEVAAAIARLKGRVTAAPVVASRSLLPGQRDYANTVALVATRAGPEKLLRRLKAIEARFGRRSGRSWGPRVIDLDIVLWSGGRWASPGLIIPHPAFRERPFVLGPLLRLAPAWRDPISGLTIRQLARRLTRPRPGR